MDMEPFRQVLKEELNQFKEDIIQPLAGRVSDLEDTTFGRPRGSGGVVATVRDHGRVAKILSLVFGVPTLMFIQEKITQFWKQ